VNKVAIALILSLASQSAFAECNWARDIKKNADGTRTYTEECHILVGKTVEELDIRREQVETLKKTVELKDLAIIKLEERNQLWMDTSIKMNDRLNSYESMKSTNQLLMFGAGVVSTVLAVWAAGQLR
jgi:hypothetical protein